MTKQKYYTIEHSNAGNPSIYREADIGWRWCCQELPEEDGWYECVTAGGNQEFLRYEKNAYPDWMSNNANLFHVVQWCKLPEPLTEGEG